MKKAICTLMILVSLLSIPALAIGQEYSLDKGSLLWTDQLHLMHWIDLIVANQSEASSNYSDKMLTDGYLFFTKEVLTVIVVDAVIGERYSKFKLVRVQSKDGKVTGWLSKDSLRLISKTPAPAAKKKSKGK